MGRGASVDVLRRFFVRGAKNGPAVADVKDRISEGAHGRRTKFQTLSGRRIQPVTWPKGTGQLA